MRLQNLPYDVRTGTDENVYTLIHKYDIKDSDLAVCLLYKELFFNLKPVSKYLNVTNVPYDAAKALPLFNTETGLHMIDYAVCDRYTELFNDIITRTSFLMTGIEDVQNGMFSLSQFCSAVLSSGSSRAFYQPLICIPTP